MLSAPQLVEFSKLEYSLSKMLRALEQVAVPKLLVDSDASLSHPGPQAPHQQNKGGLEDV